jgi:adenylate kinase
LQKRLFIRWVPRTIAQAEALDKICEELNLPIQKVVNLQADNELLIKRITGRRVCKNCGEIYHVQTLRSKVEGRCDKCGGEFIKGLMIVWKKYQFG